MDYYSSDDHSSDSGDDDRSFKLNELSPSSDSHELRTLTTQEPVTVALIMDCPTIIVCAGKCYKALIDSGAAISLISFSTYQLIDDSFKTPIQPTTTKLNTVDGSPMTALGMTALHLWTADFKFTHSFIICDRVPDIEMILALMCRRNFYYHMPKIREQIATYKRTGRFLTYMRNCKQKVTIGFVKSTLKIPPRYSWCHTH